MLSEASFCTIGMLHHLNARKKEIVSPKAQVTETAMGSAAHAHKFSKIPRRDKREVQVPCCIILELEKLALS